MRFFFVRGAAPRSKDGRNGRSKQFVCTVYMDCILKSMELLLWDRIRSIILCPNSPERHKSGSLTLRELERTAAVCAAAR